MRAKFAKLYGAGPLHLIAMVGCFVVAGYAATKLFAARPIGTAVWFGGAAVLHDVVVLPIYVAADALLVSLWRRHPKVLGRNWLAHIRLPAAISILLLVVFGAEIFRFDAPLTANSTLSSSGYFGHWLIVVGVLFGLSLLTFLARLVKR